MQKDLGTGTRSRCGRLSLAGILAIQLLGVGEPVAAQPATDHPRLWIRPADLPRLQALASAGNPLWADGLAPLAAAAKQDMDSGLVPGSDSGGNTWEQYPTEMYAQLFAFLSLIAGSPAERNDYAQRARTLLMSVMDRAVLGIADAPFRNAEFSTYDRSRWWGEAFPLTVDWIYPTLSTTDKATIRQVFLRWCGENATADTTDYNHPEPLGVTNDPALVADPLRVRWAANNYYLAHLRNMGLMALSFDAADDPAGTLSGYLSTATGAWLYVTDHLLRGDAAGGFSPEGLLYGPDALGSLAHFLLALHTAGQDDPSTWGPQVVWTGHPFWQEVLPALLHSLSPARLTYSSTSWIGEVFQPAWYGDGQEYWFHDPISLLGALGVEAIARGDASGLADLRWAELHTPPGGAGPDPWATLAGRIASTEVFRDAILTFLLFDPSAPLPADPRPGLPTVFFAPGTGRLLARTAWSESASFFTYYLGSTTVDHQLAEGNQVELYRGGEWLTKGRVGWDGTSELCTIGRSDYHNTLAVENGVGSLAPGDWLHPCQQNGSQFMQVPDGDGEILAMQTDRGFVYALGDATDLYDSSAVGSGDVSHVSRSVVWLPPDRIVLYDRAETTAAGFKRFWLNLPGAASLIGNQALVTTPGGQRLFVTTLLPAGAVVSSAPGESFPDVAVEEPMTHRLLVEAPGDPTATRFLHVVEGRDAGASVTTTSLVENDSGEPYAGAVVGEVAVLFPVSLGTFTGTSFVVPATTRTELVTGLEPDTGYAVSTSAVTGGTRVTVSPGGTRLAGAGGALVIGEPLDGSLIFADGFEDGTTVAWMPIMP